MKIGLLRGEDSAIWEKEYGFVGSEMTKGTVNLKEPFYYHQYKDIEFSNKSYFELLCVTCECWLSGRAIRFDKDTTTFGLSTYSRYGSRDNVTVSCGAVYLMDSGAYVSKEHNFRPIVSINLDDAGLKLEKKLSSEETYILSEI